MTPNDQRILVTGGCGLVGSVLVPQLLAKGYQVIVADNFSSPQSKAKEGYEFLQIDIGNLETARRAFWDVDACIALASQRGAVGYAYRNPAKILAGNNRIYNGTFQAAAEAQIRRVVFVSSSTVYESSTAFPTRESDLETISMPKSAYGFSKFIGECYCRVFHQEYGVPYTIIRPTNVYGINEFPGEEIGDSHVIPDLFKKIMLGQYPIELLSNGRQTRSFIHVTDLVQGIVLALESEYAINEDFNMGGNEEIQMLDLARLIWDFCGQEKEFRASYRAGFPNDIQRQLLDISKAQNLLGWRPRICFREGVKEMIRWLCEKYESHQEN